MRYLVSVLFFSALAFGQSTKINPDCDIQFSFTAVGSSSTAAGSCAQNLQGVRNWTMTYQSVGFSGLTLTVQEAPDNGGTPGSWSTFTAATGTNPATSTTGVGADTTYAGYAPWVRVTLSGLTGTGTVTGHLYGCRNPGCGASAGGGGGGGSPGGSTNDIQWNNAGSFGGGRCTMDSSQNIVCAGSFTSGSGSGVAGTLDLAQGTLPGSFPSNAFSLYAPTSIGISYQWRVPTADPGAGVVYSDGGATPSSLTTHALTGTGTKVVSATAAGSSGNCAQWTSAGDLGDAGSACGSGGGGSGGPSALGYSGTPASLAAGTIYFPAVGGALPSSTETVVQTAAPAAATISKLYVQLSAALGSGDSAVFTYRDGASSQPLTCTISGASATTCNDTTHSFSASAGDLLDVQVVLTGTVFSTPTVVITVQYGTSSSGGGSTISQGACASLPTSGQASGNLYKCNDQPLQYIFTSSTAAQGYFQGMPITPPPTCGSLTWVNQAGSGTCSQSTNGPLLMGITSPSGCCSAQLLVESAPSTPYSFTTQVVQNTMFVGNTTSGEGLFMGIAIRESGTGKFSACSVGVGGGTAAWTATFQHWSSATSPNSATQSGFGVPAQFIGIKLRDDGTNQYCYLSTDAGANWTLFYSESRTTFMSTGGNQVGFFQSVFGGGSAASEPVLGEFFDFTQGTN